MGLLHSILLATDYRKSSQEAADAVIQLASHFGSRVRVLHMKEEFITWPVSQFENQDRLKARLAENKVALSEFHVHAGPIAGTIVEKAREFEADLLVIGAGEKVEDGKPTLGPIAESILEHSASPTLAVSAQNPKLRFQSILCPVDHSRVSRRALDDSIQLARAFGSRLVVLSVVPDVNWLTAALDTGQLADAKLEHETRWTSEFDEFLAEASLEGLAWTRDLRSGSPHEQIEAAAREHGSDLLVMGATGRTGLVRVLLGSTTRRVLRHMPCSTLLVKDDALFDEQFLLDLDAIDRLAAAGQSKLRAGAAAEAAGSFRQVLALDPYHLAALDGLAESCTKLGQVEAAKRYRNRSERVKQRAAASGS